MPVPMIPAEAELRRLALTYPEAKEEFPWDHRAIKVKRKIFLILSRDEEDVFRVTVKLPESRRFALTRPNTAPTGYGLGKSGWVTASFQPGADVPVDVFEQWIDESYRAIAPKKLVAQLDKAADDDSASPKTERQPRKPRKKRRSSK